MIQNEEHIKEFVEEAIGHVETTETWLLKMESGSSSDAVNAIFRALHSIKGTAGFFGLKNIVDLAHVMESLFGDIRNNRLEIRHEMIDVLLAANDCLKEMIEDVYNSESVDIGSHVAGLTAIINGDVPQEPSPVQTEEMIVVDEQQNIIKIPGENVELLKDALRHGHRMYKLVLGLNRHLSGSERSPVQFYHKILSVGNIIDTYTDITDVENLQGVLDSDINCIFVFTTVLEKSLVALALELPESEFNELRLPQPQNETTIGELEQELTRNAEGDQLEEEKSVALKVQDAKVPSVLNHEELALVHKEDAGAEVKSQGAAAVDETIRVNVSLLNNLLDLAGEMVLGRNQLLRIMEGHRKSITGLESVLQNIDHITTELQDKIMHTRMQPIANVFNKFPRIVRELSRKLNKEVELHLEGTEVELDKSIIEALTDPLTHLVRNALDHGIEKPEVREKAGKNKTGLLMMSAYHEGGHVTIDIIDDGAGIRTERIMAKALQNGIVSEKELSGMTENQIMSLIFRPGFSTAEEVTDYSGRGVGMDVVKTNIERLGGTVEILSAPSHGTTFRLALPLTLAIIPSLIVEVHNQKFALPQVNLQEMVRIKPGDNSRRIEYVHDSPVLRLRGKLLPIVYLSDVLGLRQTNANPAKVKEKDDSKLVFFDEKSREEFINNIDNSSAEANLEEQAVTRILVLKIGARRYGLVVDIIHDDEEILVKPLPPYLKNCDCYSGVTILGDGRIAMILDPEGIAVRASLKFPDESQEESELQLRENVVEMQNLLLFKCSGPEMYGIDLSLVARVEEIEPESIERIGDREFINFRGDALRLIRPEYFLPVTKAENSEAKRLYVIIPKLVDHPMGILIEKIHDTVVTSIAFNQDDIKTAGLIGSSILNDRIVLLLNMYELFEMAAPEYFEAEESLITPPGEQRTILIVEDTPFFAKMEKDYLEHAGYNVLLANNGREALEILGARLVDAVVSDIVMPIMDGLELIRNIRADARLSHLPVIAVTSMTGDSHVQAGTEAGFDFYEFKLDKVRLLQKVAMVLQQGRSVI
ncbi:MAG: chemotaxis protein CheW [Candidatus Saccharibacteria bacterium]